MEVTVDDMSRTTFGDMIRPAPTILGLYDGHNSGAALVQDGAIVSAVEEERFSRIKNHDGRCSELCSPHASVRECLRHLNGHIDIIAMALEEPTALMRAIETTYAQSLIGGRLVESADWNLAKVALDAYGFQLRRVDKMLRSLELLGIDVATTECMYVNHHRAHASSVYYTSGREDALIITLDGKGDNLSGTVSRGVDGSITLMQAIDHLHSLGHFYSAITVACGFTAIRDEGKVTGLAASGEVDPAMMRRFRELYQVAGGTIISRLNDGSFMGQYPYAVVSGGRSHVDRIRALVQGREKSVVAATAQHFLEEIVIEFVRDQVQRHGIGHLQAAGGIFANVRLNQRLASLREIESFSVHPAMSDAGLAVGAALDCHYARHRSSPVSLQNVFLGPCFSSTDCLAALRFSGVSYQRIPEIEAHVARLLATGEVVCRFAGRLEYGPRALGNRSILYRADDTTVNAWLNQRLCRTETMPFAPATLDEFMDASYHAIRGARRCDEYMTITYNCTEFMREKCPGAVHVDGTARPQRVCHDSNPELHSILSTYHEMTGIPSVINTSFNMHEEPIVCTPDDAIAAWRRGGFRYLQLGDFIVERVT